MFWKVEGRTGLYIFFKTVCDYYGLIPEDNYTIPAEAEGIEPPPESRQAMPPLILKREPSDQGPEDHNSSVIEGFSDHSLSSAGTTKRHRHSPSVGATAVSTVVEEAEEEDERPSLLQSRPVTQIFESTAEEDVPAQEEESGALAPAAIASDGPTSTEPEAVAAANEPEKQSVSEDAKVDPTPTAPEKQDEDAGKDEELADAPVPSVSTSSELEVDKETSGDAGTTASTTSSESKIDDTATEKDESHTTPASDKEEAAADEKAEK